MVVHADDPILSPLDPELCMMFPCSNPSSTMDTVSSTSASFRSQSWMLQRDRAHNKSSFVVSTVGRLKPANQERGEARVVSLRERKRSWYRYEVKFILCNDCQKEHVHLCICTKILIRLMIRINSMLSKISLYIAVHTPEEDTDLYCCPVRVTNESSTVYGSFDGCS